MKKYFFIFILIICLAVFLAACYAGSVSLSWQDVKDFGSWFWSIRFPRVCLGFLVGAGLACAGVVIQSLTANPLAEPYTLGLSGGAALGASLGMVAALDPTIVSLLAFVGACVALVIILFTADMFSNNSIVLCGVMLSFIFSSFVMLIFAFAQKETVQSSVLWLMGDMSRGNMKYVILTVISVCVGFLFLWFFSKDINALSLGEEKANYLGVNVFFKKKLFFSITALIAGVCVASCGLVGFVGLMIPHVVRIFLGHDHKFLLPGCFLGGGAFLLFCDTCARTIFKPMELPVGVITGIIGGMFFLVLFVRSAKN